MIKKVSLIILFISFFTLISFGYFNFTIKIARALSVEELQEEIEQKRKEKAALDAENAKLQSQIQETGKQAQTLQTAVKTLDTTQKKLQSDLKVTVNKIGTAELAIEKTAIEIDKKEDQISINKEAMAETLRSLQRNDDESFIQQMLQYRDINEVWNGIESLKRIQNVVRQHTNDLIELKTDLVEKKKESEIQRKNLTGLKEELSDRKVIVEQNKQAKTTLLVQTKNKEEEYKKLLERNIELGKKFEQELFNFESQLKAQIDKTKLPTTKTGALSWPLNNVLITQSFGKTSDSGRLYVSGTHNGVDFRAPVGTPVLSVGSGIVSGTGNTDEQRGCYSYGRWVLVKHDNGLSSLYAHLSNSRVQNGQAVAQGQVIGYSGGQPGVSGSGYSTGPHLHLGIFATEGVSVQKYTQSMFCKQVNIPIAGINAYLDPLAYLPPLI